MKDGDKTRVDIAVLKVQMDGVQKDVSTILGNHLPHLYAKLDKVDKKNAYFSGGLAALVVLVGMILAFLQIYK